MNRNHSIDDLLIAKLKKHFRFPLISDIAAMNDSAPRRTMVQPNHDAGGDAEAVPRKTLLVSEDEIRRVKAELRKRTGARKSSKDSHDEKPYRPTHRLPVIALIACDDGKESGELFRIRGDQFVIGRTEGDFQLPHDEMVSSRHVAITRQVVNNTPHVAVTDLQSRNGLFVRASKAPLHHGSEFMVGRGHYRLEIVQDIAPATQDGGLPSGQPMTRQMEGLSVPGSVILSEIVAGRAETRTRLESSQYTIGHDPSCEIRRAHDSFIAAKHACLSRSASGPWVIENQMTLNGLWMRIPQIVISDGKSCEFRIGEQRFRMKLGVSR